MNISEYALQIINNAPPLDDERRARITAIFQGVTQSDEQTINAA